MRIISAVATNFGSYKDLAFEFSNKGLTIISGPTGAGKSTLCDIVPWALFGCTAKGGAADEVIGWGSVATEVTLNFEAQGQNCTVYRARGGKANDLWFYTESEGCEPRRGKDLKDTQKLINELLGMNVETYLAGAYLHEFSLTSQFFTTSAKNRRVTTEQLVDLTLAKTLQDKTAEFIKYMKEEKQHSANLAREEQTKLTLLEANLSTAKDKARGWESTHQKMVAALALKVSTFDESKASEISQNQALSMLFEDHRNEDLCDLYEKIEAEKSTLADEIEIDIKIAELLTTRESLAKDLCKECGSSKSSDKVLVLTKDINTLERKKSENTVIKRNIYDLQRAIKRKQSEVNLYDAKVEQALNSQNTHHTALEMLLNTTNPHADTSYLVADISSAKSALEAARLEVEDSTREIADAESLQDAVAAFRASLITRVIGHLETTTNKLLEAHFDAEIRVKFEANDNDKIEVEIAKDGNLCSFTQLSKGQRQILKLAFGVSIMRAVAMSQGVTFNTIFFDETLDGMSDAMKAKAFTLLEEVALQHESVFVVDHTESFKTLFTSTINVTLGSHGSEIEQD